MRAGWLVVASISSSVTPLGTMAHAESFVERGASAVEPSAMPARIRFGTPAPLVKLDRVAIQLRVDDDHVMATLELELSTKVTTLQETAIELELPAGTRASGLVVAINGTRESAFLREAGAARTKYVDTVAQVRDPALLELVDPASKGSASARDRFKLSVFPIAAGKPAIVQVQLELPRSTVLELDPGMQTIEHVDVELEKAFQVTRASWARVAKPKTLLLGAPTAAATSTVAIPPLVVPRGYVDATRSLVAAEIATAAWSAELPVMSTGLHRHYGGDPIDKSVIRRMFRVHAAQIRYCYEREAQRNPSLGGEVRLHFRIAAEGIVSVQDVTGDLENATVRACVSAQVTSWSFPAGPGTVEVYYPLTFKLAGP